ncbi:hypothetical protein L914_12649 [Phytophthora nicotianae]|uniref:Uncharacterized protein n=1 Tax=Phytophthora nicotianae TaxID=4792 RepID=W2MYT2_PHYNI|nr:hypothetical protein L914_12649 [Phytophthora nicotianae]
MNTIKDEISRLEGAVLKPDREEQFEAQSWEALRKSGNPVPHTAREYANVFPNKIPAELPANCGVNHEINLVPEANYHRKADHVRESSTRSRPSE